MNSNFNLEDFPVLETERLQLRELQLTDAGAVFRCLSNEAVTRYWGVLPFSSIQQAEGFIQSCRDGFAERQRIRWGIVRKEDGAFMGTCGFHAWNKGCSRCEIGYELAEEYWGHGYATEAIRALTSFGFRVLELHRIGAVVYLENTASQHVLEKLGFAKEGILRDYMKCDGKYYDVYMSSLLHPTNLKES
ncbi:GNAT family N-acetyltransferase [Ectobacillus ponti]|uniref:GNAT family N-acetyltransferase n=1 Tax=Ectobacillus ponti TaxID=2961894 RepID=A0AA41X746_9BACI|nr:GNAT family protein [Ectobacillus ponti]MCP8967545.1 GNAT family N-acetyltransferase [Ectobacillus ponti]